MTETINYALSSANDDIHFKQYSIPIYSRLLKKPITESFIFHKIYYKMFKLDTCIYSDKSMV